MKLSDPKFAALARRMDQERVLVIAIAALINEKRPFDEIATILEIDPCITGDIGMEILGLLNTIPAKKPRKASELCPMTREWKPSQEDLAYAARYRLTTSEVKTIENDFRDYWIGNGARRNWGLTWQNRVRDRATWLKKAPPLDLATLQPNSENGAPRAPDAPKAIDWKTAWNRWRNSQVWMRGYGPSPDQPGCLMPPVYRTI